MAFPTRSTIGTTCLMVATLVVPLLSGCAPAKVAIPDKFTEYNSMDGTFAINYPDGWDVEGTGSRSRGKAYAIFTKGPMEIRLDASFFDSLASGSGTGQQIVGEMAGVDGGFNMLPEEMIQEKNLSWFEEHFEKFEDKEQELVKIPLGKACLNEFSGQKDWLKVKGMRASIMARDRTVSFHAYCPASKWDDFGPIFRKMFDELKMGKEPR